MKFFLSPSRPRLNDSVGQASLREGDQTHIGQPDEDVHCIHTSSQNYSTPLCRRNEVELKKKQGCILFFIPFSKDDQESLLCINIITDSLQLSKFAPFQIMNALIDFSINGNNFVLSPGRTMFWEKQKTLVIAGFHIGKPGHSPKPGIVLRQTTFKEDLQRLTTEILSFKAEQLIIAGDLTHSRSAKELELFKKWRNYFSLLTILLANDSDGVTETAWYDELNIVRKEKLQIDKFSFCKSPEDINPASYIAGTYTFCSHLRPGIPVKGARNKVSLFPCFYFKTTYAVLPAFSGFTDLTTIGPGEGENVFAISDTGIVQVQ